ncbi:MAG: substrate-binding domain-containing protein [Candidatus Firestonebacteria bacterium]|nr:substrate-binding domain-containing protein [Candidatus Firestonebacteria bacterium]
MCLKTDLNVTYKPSGEIYDILENGGKCDVFISASIKYPIILLEKKLTQDYKVFGYDEICIINFNPRINKENWINSILESKRSNYYVISN